MKKRNNYIMLAILLLMLPIFHGYGQVNKVYKYTYDSSGNRKTRMPVLTTQSINLSNGWNIISANVLPEVRSMMPVVQPLINTGQLVKVTDEAGHTIENWGVFGGWVNAIGDIQATEGYKVNVNANCVLGITGDQIALPLSISLTSGWNIISFPQTMEVNGMEVIQPLLNEGSLMKVTDEAGNSIENWGVFGGWVNNIGNFKAGEGYNVRVSFATELTINDSYTKSTVIPLVSEKTEHFSPAYKGKGVDHMNINIVDILPGIVEEGDEISGYDGKLCVGTVKITQQQLKNNRIELIVSASDDIGGLGFAKGNHIKLKLWKKAANADYALRFETVKGGLKFEKFESSFIRLKALEKSDLESDLNENMTASKTEESQQNPEIQPDIVPNLKVQTISDNVDPITENLETSLKCYPNPLTDDVAIEFFLPTDARVNISIYNSAGKLIRTITDGKLERGTKRFNWNRTDETERKVASGLYLCKLMVDNHSYDNKLIVR
ncbi:MAG: T9SS type A sorting domain-containing protein [Prolixibacteraceae bacterium]|nr:T9SS type A sorting domain-containing protein [Prolixibacteraceae bacterium]